MNIVFKAPIYFVNEAVMVGRRMMGTPISIFFSKEHNFENHRL